MQPLAIFYQNNYNKHGNVLIRTKEVMGKMADRYIAYYKAPFGLLLLESTEDVLLRRSEEHRLNSVTSVSRMPSSA